MVDLKNHVLRVKIYSLEEKLPVVLLPRLEVIIILFLLPKLEVIIILFLLSRLEVIIILLNTHTCSSSTLGYGRPLQFCCFPFSLSIITHLLTLLLTHTFSPTLKSFTHSCSYSCSPTLFCPPTLFTLDHSLIQLHNSLLTHSQKSSACAGSRLWAIGPVLLLISKTTGCLSDCLHLTHATMTWRSIGTARPPGHMLYTYWIQNQFFTHLLKESWTFLFLVRLLRTQRSIKYTISHVDICTVWFLTNNEVLIPNIQIFHLQ